MCKKRNTLSPFHREINDLLDSLDDAVFSALKPGPPLSQPSKVELKRKLMNLTLDFQALHRYHENVPPDFYRE